MGEFSWPSSERATQPRTTGHAGESGDLVRHWYKCTNNPRDPIHVICQDQSLREVKRVGEENTMQIGRLAINAGTNPHLLYISCLTQWLRKISRVSTGLDLPYSVLQLFNQ